MELTFARPSLMKPKVTTTSVNSTLSVDHRPKKQT